MWCCYDLLNHEKLEREERREESGERRKGEWCWRHLESENVVWNKLSSGFNNNNRLIWSFLFGSFSIFHPSSLPYSLSLSLFLFFPSLSFPSSSCLEMHCWLEDKFTCLHHHVKSEFKIKNSSSLSLSFVSYLSSPPYFLFSRVQRHKERQFSNIYPSWWLPVGMIGDEWVLRELEMWREEKDGWKWWWSLFLSFLHVVDGGWKGLQVMMIIVMDGILNEWWEE